MASSGDRQTLSADGTTNFKKYVGPVVVSISGGFGSGAAIVQKRDSSDAVVSISGTSVTALSDKILDFVPSQINDIAVNLSGSTAPALVVEIQGNEL